MDPSLLVTEYFKTNRKIWLENKHVQYVYTGGDRDDATTKKMTEYLKSLEKNPGIAKGPLPSYFKADHRAIFIGVDDLEHAEVKAITNSIAKDNIPVRVVIQKEKLKHHVYNCKYGSQLLYRTLWNDTVAATVVKGGQNYMLTCGYEFEVGAEIRNPANNEIFAQVAARVYGGKSDASISLLVQGTGLCPSNYMGGPNNVSNTISDAEDGELVQFNGAATGYHTGYVESLDFSTTIGTTVFEDLIRVNLGSAEGPGDSGSGLFSQGNPVQLEGLLVTGDAAPTPWAAFAQATPCFASLGLAINSVVFS